MTNDQTHLFTVAGLGSAPFTYVGNAEIPSSRLAEHNPDAYNNALRELPRHLKGGCGTCSYCGLAITIICIVRNAEGDEFGVGSDCILKAGGEGVVSKLKLALKARRKKIAEAKREVKRLEWLKANQPRLDAEKAARETAESERKQKIEAKLLPIAEAISSLKFHAETSSFYRSLLEQINAYGSLSERQAEYVAKAHFGRRTRKNEIEFIHVIDILIDPI
jgi:hypothetical protein